MKRSNYIIIKKLRIIFIAIFLLSIYLPIIDWITPFRLSTRYDATENRRLAELPEFKISNISEFPNKYDIYFNDNMPFREDLLKLNGLLGMKQIDKKSNAFVHEGKNGWCYVQKYIKEYVNKTLFTDEQLDSLRNIYEERGKFFKKKGIKAYVAVVPCKANIYPEFLPNYIFKYQSKSRKQQLFDILNNNDNIKLIDITKSLLAAKKKYPDKLLFYKTDQHWNEFGALIGLSQIIDTLRKDFPEFKHISPEDYNIEEKTIEGKQLAVLLKKKEILTDINYKLIPKQPSKHKITVKGNINHYKPNHNFPYKKEYVFNYIVNNNKPKILLIRDSYTNAIRPRLKEGCGLGDVVMVWDNWCYKLNKSITLKENPKIHLTILIDGNIPFILSQEPDKR